MSKAAAMVLGESFVRRVVLREQHRAEKQVQLQLQYGMIMLLLPEPLSGK